jgi:RHS repeat-associated protein
LFEYNDRGAQIAGYTNGPEFDEVLSVKRSGVTSYFQRDGLGSVIQTFSSAGIDSSFTYDSYGRILSQSGTARSPYSFTGREYDAESGLYYYRGRYYDPQVGRFISEDPLGFAAGDTNLYAYVGNNPINFSDPLGLQWWKFLKNLIPSPDPLPYGDVGILKSAPMTYDQLTKELKTSLSTLKSLIKRQGVLIRLKARSKQGTKTYCDANNNLYVVNTKIGELSNKVADLQNKVNTVSDVYNGVKKDPLWGNSNDPSGLSPVYGTR